MLTNGGHLYFNQMGDFLILPTKVYINESSMDNNLSFLEVANIAGEYIKMDTSKEKLINVQIEDRKIFYQKEFSEGLFTPILINSP